MSELKEFSKELGIKLSLDDLRSQALIEQSVILAARKISRGHIVKVWSDQFTIEHPLCERFEGKLVDCEIIQKHMDWVDDNCVPDDGWFYLNDDGSLGDSIEK